MSPVHQQLSDSQGPKATFITRSSSRTTHHHPVSCTASLTSFQHRRKMSLMNTSLQPRCCVMSHAAAKPDDPSLADTANRGGAAPKGVLQLIPLGACLPVLDADQHRVDVKGGLVLNLDLSTGTKYLIPVAAKGLVVAAVGMYADRPEPSSIRPWSSARTQSCAAPLSLFSAFKAFFAAFWSTSVW